MHSRVMLAILLEVARLAAAAPANSFPPNFDPKQFDIQPNKGGNPQDDCGNGPISLDRDTWNSHNMDALVQQVWDSGNGNPKFDFHQAFASKYTDALQCPDSFSNCIGDPSACSALSGSSADKEQGWLGIKAILNVQGFFLQMEKVTSNAADGISGALVDFQKVGSPHRLRDWRLKYSRNSTPQPSRQINPGNESWLAQSHPVSGLQLQRLELQLSRLQLAPRPLGWCI